jgi:aminoglycoside phosphotransferase (APT) family kinase protein
METKEAIGELGKLIDSDRVMSVWKKAISSKWENDPVWIHGDFASGNIIIRDKHLVAVIDFGGMAIGDPACDLVISWTFLKGEARKIFKEYIGLDNKTWSRARGWALWKALITIVSLKDRSSIAAIEQLQIINEIIDEHELEKQSLSS